MVRPQGLAQHPGPQMGSLNALISVLKNGAPTGTRTPDPLIKSQPLYQLSYRRT